MSAPRMQALETKEQSLPDDTLSLIFSGLKPKEVEGVKRVSKQWKTLAEDTSSWSSFLQELFKVSDEKDPKVFFKSLISKPFYLVGNSIKVAEPMHGVRIPTPRLLPTAQLLTALPTGESEVHIFFSQEAAERFARQTAVANPINQNAMLDGYYHYSPVFSVMLGSARLLERGEGYYKKMPANNVSYVLGIHYEAGAILGGQPRCIFSLPVLTKEQPQYIRSKLNMLANMPSWQKSGITFIDFPDIKYHVGSKASMLDKIRNQLSNIKERGGQLEKFNALSQIYRAFYSMNLDDDASINANLKLIRQHLPVLKQFQTSSPNQKYKTIGLFLGSLGKHWGKESNSYQLGIQLMDFIIEKSHPSEVIKNKYLR